MVAGQALDLEAESTNVSGEDLERIHRHKTGALIRSAARCGAIIAGANEPNLNAITGYAANLGMLFQITDDLLDVTATAEDLGKTPGKDARSRKATFPALYGIEATRQRVNEVHRQACDALELIDRPAQLLAAMADFIRERQA
jgi:geranylgeranyl pyrophosphate synthase